ncbi:MAG: DUF1449 domain-containing protein [Oleiphilaceae bacterium]|nr:DUF1449 domain-containing protein [Oleiphilaceae bacterium]
MFAIFLTKEMDPFYQNIASFPTVIFTFLLLIVLFYWLVAMLGWVEIDMLDFDLPDGGLDTELGGDAGMSNANALAGLMLRYGLSGVPVTVIVSFIALFGWFASYYAVHFLLAGLGDGWLRFLAGIPVLIGAFYGAVLLTALVIKPLRHFFKRVPQETIKRVLGQTAVVRTSRVDEAFGEATLEDGGAGLVLKVRASPGSSFKLGDRVVLIEYDAEGNTYRVISESEFTGE